MNEQMPKKNYVITIGRQFGCGAREIGLLVAHALGIPYYDKELMIEAAKSTGVRQQVFEAADERAPKFFSGLWAFNIGFNNGSQIVTGNTGSSDSVYNAQSEVIIDIAQRGPCVIVGRTADYILRNHATVISIFIHATLDERVNRMIQRGDSNSPEEAIKRAEKENKQRAEYYNFYTDRTWGDAQTYDLCINESTLGVDNTAKLIVDYVKSRIQD